MKKLLTLSAMILICSVTASAKCWRLNPDPNSGADCFDAGAISTIEGLQSGDTILADPGEYGTLNFAETRNITVIGTGYLLSDNKGWPEAKIARFSRCVMKADCKLIGCEVLGSIANDYSPLVMSGNVVIKCKVGGSIYVGDYGLVQQSIADLISVGRNGIVRNNICTSIQAESMYTRANCIIENNTVVGKGMWYSPYNLLVGGFHSSNIKNNIFIIEDGGETFEENGVTMRRYERPLLFENNNIYENNVLSATSDYSNQAYSYNYFVGATSENTFVNEGSDDAKWQLKEGSPAKKAATHGGDCGAFGGATPYVLSGRPYKRPHIAQLHVPAKPTDGKVTVKLLIENQNE